MADGSLLQVGLDNPINTVAGSPEYRSDPILFSFENKYDLPGWGVQIQNNARQEAEEAKKWNIE